MHNGGISEFGKIKRRLQSYLPDDLFNMVNGNTGVLCVHGLETYLTPSLDSQWAFALFLSKLPNPYARTFTPEALRQAMMETIAEINAMTEDAGITEVGRTGLLFQSHLTCLSRVFSTSA